MDKFRCGSAMHIQCKRKASNQKNSQRGLTLHIIKECLNQDFDYLRSATTRSLWNRLRRWRQPILYPSRSSQINTQQTILCILTILPIALWLLRCGESPLPIQHNAADECTNIYTKQNDKREIIPTPKRQKMLRQKERWSTAINIHCRRGPERALRRGAITLCLAKCMLAFRECRESRHNSRSNNYSQSKMGNKINYVHGVRRSAVFDL